MPMRAEPVEARADALPAGLADTIARLRRAMRRAARATDPSRTLSGAQLELLTCVAANPGIRPGHLARLLNLRPNTVTTLVNGLVELGLIGRTQAEDDRRAQALSLTAGGHGAVQARRDTNNVVLDQAVAALTAPQRNALAKAVPVLAALSAAIDHLADAA